MALRSERIELRPIVRDDLEKLNNWKNNEKIYQNLGGGFLPVSIDIQEKWLDSLMDTTGNNKRFMIQLGNEAIGMIGLYNINWIHRTCELGIFIGEEDKQGQGYAVEAYRLIDNYAHKFLNLRKVKAYVVSDNGSAMRMYDRLDFRKAGELMEERFIAGEYRSVFIMEKFLGGG